MKAVFTYPILIVLSLLFVSFNEVSSNNDTTNDDGYLRWNERKLSWSDFKGEVPNNSKFHASTQSAINLDYSTQNTIITFKIETIFDPSTSWKKENVNDYILEHEQIHFDITEYHTRMMRKAIEQKKFNSLASIDREMKVLYHEIHDKAKEMQEKYDHQTKHALNKKKQSKWSKKMERLLGKTDQYQLETIKIDISNLLEN